MIRSKTIHTIKDNSLVDKDIIDEFISIMKASYSGYYADTDCDFTIMSNEWYKELKEYNYKATRIVFNELLLEHNTPFTIEDFINKLNFFHFTKKTVDKCV